MSHARVHHDFGSEAVHELRRDAGRQGRHDQRLREEGQPGLDRAVAQHVLEVEGPDEERREHPCDQQAADDGRAGQRAQLQNAQRHDRIGQARLEHDEEHEERRWRAPRIPKVWAESQPYVVAVTTP